MCYLATKSTTQFFNLHACNNTDLKANEQFYPPTNDEMPLAFGDFVIVRLTTESTEKLTSIALRVTKSQTVSLYFGILHSPC